jgi:hypothetical protein
VNAVAEGVLPKEIVQDKLKKLREDEERLELELAQGRVIAFPKINVTGQFIEGFREICKSVMFSGDEKKRKTFLKNMIKKIDLTKTTCKVSYNLSRFLISHTESSSLRDNLVEQMGFEPTTYALRTHRSPS